MKDLKGISWVISVKSIRWRQWHKGLNCKYRIKIKRFEAKDSCWWKHHTIICTLSVIQKWSICSSVIYLKSCYKTPPPPQKKREEKRPTLRCMYTGFKIMFACHLCRQTKLSYRDHLSMVSIKAWTNKLNVTGLWWWNSFREHFSGIKTSSMLLVDLVRPSFGYLGLTTFLYWFFY